MQGTGGFGYLIHREGEEVKAGSFKGQSLYDEKKTRERMIS